MILSVGSSEATNARKDLLDNRIVLMNNHTRETVTPNNAGIRRRFSTSTMSTMSIPAPPCKLSLELTRDAGSALSKLSISKTSYHKRYIYPNHQLHQVLVGCKSNLRYDLRTLKDLAKASQQHNSSGTREGISKCPGHRVNDLRPMRGCWCWMAFPKCLSVTSEDIEQHNDEDRRQRWLLDLSPNKRPLGSSIMVRCVSGKHRPLSPRTVRERSLLYPPNLRHRLA